MVCFFCFQKLPIGFLILFRAAAPYASLSFFLSFFLALPLTQQQRGECGHCLVFMCLPQRNPIDVRVLANWYSGCRSSSLLKNFNKIRKRLPFFSLFPNFYSDAPVFLRVCFLQNLPQETTLSSVVTAAATEHQEPLPVLTHARVLVHDDFDW